MGIVDNTVPADMAQAQIKQGKDKKNRRKMTNDEQAELRSTKLVKTRSQHA